MPTFKWLHTMLVLLGLNHQPKSIYGLELGPWHILSRLEARSSCGYQTSGSQAIPKLLLIFGISLLVGLLHMASVGVNAPSLAETWYASQGTSRSSALEEKGEWWGWDCQRGWLRSRAVIWVSELKKEYPWSCCPYTPVKNRTWQYLDTYTDDIK